MAPRNPRLISAIQKARHRYTWTPFRIAALGVCLSHVNDLFYQSYRTQGHYPLTEGSWVESGSNAPACSQP